jgi:hypothetical protein
MPIGAEDLICENREFLHRTHSMAEALEGADVIMMLRVQFERMDESFFPSIREYFRYYGLTRERVDAQSRTPYHASRPDQPRRRDRYGCRRRTFLCNPRPGCSRRSGADGDSLSHAGRPEFVNLLIKNGRVIDPERKLDSTADVLILDGRFGLLEKQRIATFLSGMPQERLSRQASSIFTSICGNRNGRGGNDRHRW